MHSVGCSRGNVRRKQLSFVGTFENIQPNSSRFQHFDFSMVIMLGKVTAWAVLTVGLY